MIPGLLGLVVMFMTTLMTALGVVRERELGTMEQLVVTPLRPLELMLGKILPYLLVGAVDFALVFAAGLYLFDLTFAGNLPLFLLLSLLLVLTTLGLGLLPGVAVIPAHDHWSEDAAHRTRKMSPPSLVLVGIDERTALIRDPQGAWRSEGAGETVVFVGGDHAELDALPS